MMRQSITYILLLFSFQLCYGKTIYFNSLNNFQSIANENIVDGKLIDENKTTSLIFRPFRFNLENNDCRFEIRFANIHNQENKSYYTINSVTGKRTKVTNTTWGVIWNFVDELNYNSVSLQCHNSNTHDILDERYMTITISRVSNGVESILKTNRIDKGVNLYSDYNVVSISNKSTNITIRIGNNELKSVYDLNEMTTEINNVGYFVGAGAKVVIERAALAYTPQMEKVLSTDWNLDKLNSYFDKSNDIHEGYWEYLDRNVDETKLRLGGRYKIALVRNENGYDILYIDGGKVNEMNWKCGMLKGRLINTQFTDNYNLNWYDAMMDIFSVDVTAYILNNTILELKFPIQKSSIRFTKIYK